MMNWIKSNVDFLNTLSLISNRAWKLRFTLTKQLIHDLSDNGVVLEVNSIKRNEHYTVFKLKSGGYIKITHDTVLRNIYIDAERSRDIVKIYYALEVKE